MLLFIYLFIFPKLALLPCATQSWRTWQAEQKVALIMDGDDETVAYSRYEC